LDPHAQLQLRAERSPLLKAIEDNTQAQDQANQLLQQQNQLLTQQKQDAQNAYNVLASNSGQIIKGLTDIISGQIGGKAGLGFMTPGYAGGGVRY
jgi:hypothetical protein